ncbi:hypothetical protein Tco_0763965 [Tanacetum coccineum]
MPSPQPSSSSSSSSMSLQIREKIWLLNGIEALYEEILDVLNGIEVKNKSDELTNHIIELKDQLMKERQDYLELFQSSGEEIDVFELNRLRHSLVMVLVRITANNLIIVVYIQEPKTKKSLLGGLPDPV